MRVAAKCLLRKLFFLVVFLVSEVSRRDCDEYIYNEDGRLSLKCGKSAIVATMYILTTLAAFYVSAYARVISFYCHACVATITVCISEALKT